MKPPFIRPKYNGVTRPEESPPLRQRMAYRDDPVQVKPSPGPNYNRNMQFVLETDNFGRLIGTLSDGRGEATVTSANIQTAISGLLTALEDTERSGRGECFWEEGGGDYRWVFARDGNRLRMTVLWSAGTLTGWENVLWWERPFDELVSVLRTEIGRLGVSA